MLHLMRHDIAYAEDPSNRDRRHQRVRVREELLPLLHELSPGIVEHLNALADALVATGTQPELDGVGLTLGRAQRLLLARAVSRRQRKARIWLPGGAVLGLDRATLEPRVLAHERRRKP